MKTNSSRSCVFAAGFLVIQFAFQLCVQGQACAPAPTGLVATWRAESNAVDSVAGYTGSLENVSFATGEVGQSFVFNPSTGTTRVSIPDQPAFVLTNSLSIEGWINPTGPGGWTVFWRGDNRGGLDPYFLQMNPDDGNTLQFIIEQESPNISVIIETAPLAYNQWCHIAATLDGGTGNMLLYTNGVLAASTNTTIRPFANLIAADDASIGIGNLGEHFFDHPFVGKIDEISLYSRALSQSEVQGIYNAGSAGKCSPGSCVAAPSGIVGWWQAEGDAQDAVGGNNGTLLNGTTMAAGEAGQAFRFDGVNDYVKIPRTSNLDVGNQVTIEFWMKADPANAMNTYQGLVTSDFYGIEIANGYVLGPLGVNFFLSTDGGASVSPSSYPDTATVNGGGAVVTAGQWHHVAGTYDGTKLQLYIDGQPWGNPNYHTGAISPMLASSFVSIGAEDGRTICPGCVGNRYFNGMIDEATIYNRALAAAEIQSIYNAGSAGKCAPIVQTNVCVTPPSGLVGWWPGEGNANDVVGGNNAMLQGGAIFASGKVGQGFRLDGTNGYVQIADSDALKPANVTVESWVWLDPGITTVTNPRLEYLIFKKNSWDFLFEGYSLLKESRPNGDGTYTDRFSFVVTSGGNQVITYSTTAVQRGVWYHVAGTYDGNKLTLWVNGAAEATAIAGFALDYGTLPVFIGTSGQPAPYNGKLAGILDEPSIYNRALSTNEIVVIYNASSAGKCAPAGATNNCVTPPTGIVGWWKSDGNASDSAGTNNGVLQNVTFNPGEVGQAFACNQNLPYGTYSGVQIADQPAYALTNSLSIEGWVRPTGDGYVIFFRGDHRPGLDPYFLSMQGNHDLVFAICDQNGNTGSVDATIPYFQWTHVAATLDGNTGNISLYTNGVLAAHAVTAIRPFGNLIPGETPGIGIGNVNDGGNNFPFMGDIDEIALYNRALSPGEIQSLDNAGSAGKCAPVQAGLPTISNFTPASATPGSIVTISGNNFSPVPPNNIVYFGAVKANVLTATTTSLTVSVPPGATFASPTVTVNGLTAWASASFLPTYSGAGTITSSSLAPRVDLGSGNGPGRVAIGDLDGDGKPDLVAANAYDSTVWIYRNLSTNGILATTSFAPPVVLPIVGNGSGYQVGLALADLDGDGRLDIVVGNGGFGNVSIFQNLSAPGSLTTSSFAARLDFATGSAPQDVVARDLDGDGRPEIISANGSDDTVSVLKNLGIAGSITTNSFAAAVNFATGPGPLGVAVADLDGDGKPELVIANYHDSNQAVSVLRNISTLGNISSDSFAPKVDFPGLPSSLSVTIGDLDGDGKLDLVVGSYVDGQAISVYRNTSTPGSINTGSFAGRVDFATGARTHTTAIGDLDGDGKPDVAVVSELPSQLSIFKNTGAPGSFTTGSFASRVDFLAGYNAWGVAIGDLNGDGRPDLAFANQYDQTVSIYRNIIPASGQPIVIMQPADQTATIGNTAAFSVLAEGNNPLNYQWQFNGTNISSATNTSLTLFNVQPGQAGNYSVLVSNLLGGVASSNALLTVNPAVCTLPPAGLISWWMGQSNSLDGVSGNHGNLQNGAGFAPAKVGSGFLLDGADDYLLVTGSPSLNVGTASGITFEGWINPTTLASSMLIAEFERVLASFSGSDVGVQFAINVPPGTGTGPGSIVANIKDTTDADHIFSSPPNLVVAGVWQHVAWAYDKASGVATFYLNGVAVASANLGSFTPQTSFTNLLIGARTTFNSVPNPSDMFSGGLDELSLYDRALSAAEIQSIYNAGSAGKCDVPIAPTIVAQPHDIAVPYGTIATFSVVAGGTVPLSYQWLLNHTNILGETNSALTLANVQFNQSGEVYSVIITNLGGIATSSNAVLTVINNLPQVSTIASLHAPANQPTAPLAFTISDVETPADQLILSALSSNPSVVPTNQIIFGGSGSNRTVTITPSQIGVTTITIAATDEAGGVGSSSFQITVDAFTQLTNIFPILSYGKVAWGDYDNDGRLDLLVSGTTNNAPSGAITRIYHNDGGVFTNFISLTGVFKSAEAWGDYDRDGRLDVLISGLTSSNLPITRVYHNNGDGTFTDINAGLTACYSGTVAWGDFNNDGAADIFLSGLVTTTNVTTAITTNLLRLYRNDNGVFTDMNLNLPLTDNRLAGPSLGTATWGDYDNDGRLDLLLVGSVNNFVGIAGIYRNLGNGTFSNVFNSPIASSFYPGGSGAWGDYDNDGWLDFAISSSSASTYVYHNNRNGTFTQITVLASGLTPSVAWGDYDNDGDLDLLVGTGSTSRLYRNNGNGTFTDTVTSLPAPANGSAAWGDFDNDGNLDIAFVGGKTTLVRNNNGTPNTPPVAPANLATSLTLSNSAILTWSRPLDSQTLSNGLNYNLRVGTNEGGIDLVSPQADPITGVRRIAAMGNTSPTNRAQLINLPKGTYYWSVQAIDTAFAGSFFPGGPAAKDATFTITNARPSISDIADQIIAPGTNAPGPVIPFVIGDLETSASNLVLTARSSNTNVVAVTNIVFGGFGSNRTVRVAARTNGISVITVTVTDAQGAFASDNFTVRAEQFTLVSTNFVQVQNSLIAWGDYNNDGRLDVLIAGATNGNAGIPFPDNVRPITQLYRNDGNGVFTPVASGLPNVTRGSAAWGDYNNDGNLDLLLTGTTNNGLTSGAISRIYRNNGDGTFTNINAGLPGMFNSAVAWGDYDNDGRMDFIIAGQTNAFTTTSPTTRIYHNNGDGTFSNAVTLTGVYLGSVAWADFDGDGDLDIVIAGSGASLPVTLVYRNNGNGTFTQAASLTGVYNSSVATGDFDNDGRPDILLAGYNGSTAVSIVYRNTGNFSFSNIGLQLPGARLASAAWGDFDNDGRLDILISGTSGLAGIPLSSGAFTRIYRNTGSTVLSQSFSNFPVNLPTNYSGTVTWADFDNDGRLDILLTGTDGVLDRLQTARSQTALFRNNNNVFNTPPTAPAALVSTRSNNIVSLTWGKSTDAQTRTIVVSGQVTNYDGLKYQLRVGTTPGGIQTESPLADLSTGYRRVVQTGDASTNQWQLLNLPVGTYYWSVQAIDTAFAGSPFATENSFIITHPPVAIADAVSTPSNTPAFFPAAKLAVNDIDVDGYPLTVIGVSVKSTQNGTVVLASDHITYTPPTNFIGNDTFTYTVSDGLGGSAVGTVTVTVGSGGLISLNIVSGPLVDGSDFVVRFAGIPGFIYTIEAADALNGPWAKVANLTAPDTDTGFGIGVFEFRESMGAHSTRFYRTVYPAY